MTVATTFSDACQSYLVTGDVLQRWGSGSIGGFGTNDDSPALGTISSPISSLRVTPPYTAQPGYLFTFRAKITGVPGTNLNLCRFVNGGVGGTSLGGLQVNSSGKLRLVDGSGAQIVIDTVFTLDANWHVYEVGWLAAASPNGKFEVRVDGVQIAALTVSSLGGSAAGTYDTGHFTIDTLELSGASGLAMQVDFVILRSATAIWGPSDWFADSTVAPFLKKKTVQLVAGTAGNGTYGPAGAIPTTWVIGAGAPGASFSDVLRSVPFNGDVDYLTISGLAGSGAGNTVTSKLQPCPSDVRILRCVTAVKSMRSTAAGGSQTKHWWHDALGDFSSSPDTDSPAGYKHILWPLDKHPDGSTVWTKAVFDGSGSGVVPEVGAQLVSFT